MEPRGRRRRQRRTRRCGLPERITEVEKAKVRRIYSGLKIGSLMSFADQLSEPRRKGWQLAAVVRFIAKKKPELLRRLIQKL